MSERRKRATAKNKMLAYIGAGIVHAIIIGALIFNFSSDPQEVETATEGEISEIVQATVINEEDLKKEQDKLKKADEERIRKKKREEQRLRDLRKKREQEEQRIKNLEKQKELEQKKADQLEAERKKIALQKAEEDKKLREAKAERERVEEEQRQLAEAERIRQEEEQLETQRLLQEAIAAEERLQAEKLAQQRTTTLIAKYSGLVRDRVDSFRTIAPDFERWRVAEVNIKVSPFGEVLRTSIIKSSGSQRYDKSVEDAILKASPLPIPDLSLDPEANKLFQDIDYEFPMPGM